MNNRFNFIYSLSRIKAKEWTHPNDTPVKGQAVQEGGQNPVGLSALGASLTGSLGQHAEEYLQLHGQQLSIPLDP